MATEAEENRAILGTQVGTLLAIRETLDRIEATLKAYGLGLAAGLVVLAIAIVLSKKD